MKVLLIQPKTYALGFTDLIMGEPLGLEMIGGALQNNHDVRIFDLRINNSLHHELLSFKPDICGISCSYTIDYHPTMELIKHIKEILPRSFIVVGGLHASMNYQDFLSNRIGAVVIGEGEQTFKDLVDCMRKKGDLSFLPGLAINWEGRQIITHPRAVQENLDSLPFPLRNLKKNRYYHLGFQKPAALVETSRGCVYRCSFCAVWQFYNGTYRVKTPERVVQELMRINEPYIFFVDDNFLANIHRAERIANLIRENCIKKTYSFQARSDTIVRHPDIIKLWKEIGLCTIFIGFEKVEDEGLEDLNKKNTVENNDKALRLLKDLDINVWASFIVNPDYERKDFKKLKDYIITRKIKTPTFSIFTPLPGTELFRQLKEKLISQDYRLFDIAHTVLPTKLPIKEFYEEFCSLYKLPYSRLKLIWEGLKVWFSRKFSLLHLLSVARSVKKLADPKSYLVAHEKIQNNRESFIKKVI
jgi:radical SAM superfamily enzyme YgiQ (UPF0313 family)